MQPAPFFADAAQGPAGGHALWARAEDGTRLRLAHWPTDGAARGTVFLFNGRSEYAEKYGPTAAALTRAGWHVATLDWRGQGLSDRNGPDPMLGHVVDFAEYQQDARALLGQIDLWFSNVGSGVVLAFMNKGFSSIVGCAVPSPRRLGQWRGLR